MPLLPPLDSFGDDDDVLLAEVQGVDESGDGCPPGLMTWMVDIPCDTEAGMLWFWSGTDVNGDRVL